MLKQIPLALLSALFVLPSVSLAEEKKSSRPAWVDGSSTSLYSEQRYLTAVGTGKSRESASQDAKKQLAGIFRSKISSESSTQNQSSLSEDTGSKVEGKGTSQSQSNITVQTNLELRGVAVKEFFFDTSSKEHYALAVMDKLQVKNSYQMDLLKIKNKLISKHERFLTKPDIANANEILKLSEQYDLLNQEFSVVNNGHSSPDPLSNSQLEEIRENIPSLQNTKAILLEYTGSEDQKEFQELITSCLSEKSIAVIAKAKEDQSPEYHVLYNLREKKKFMDVKGWEKYQFTSLAVIKKGNILVERKQISKECSGRTKETAFDTIKEDLSQEICSKIATVVTR